MDDKFTKEEVNRLVDVARGTWDAIASDVMAASGKKAFRRSEVIEMVLDADRMRRSGGKDFLPLYERFRKASQRFRKQVMLQAFGDSLYGL